MSTIYLGILAHERARSNAVSAVMEAPAGSVVRISERTRTLEQNAKMHGIFRDISQQWQFLGRHRDEETVKRLMVDAFIQVMRDMGTPLENDHSELLPSIDGKRIVQLGAQTAHFTVREMSLFIDFLQAWCAEQGIELFD